ncbi:MAG: LysR family transcriptional regulator, partial [Pseudomonadota bacterium]
AAARLQCTQPAVSSALTKFEKASGLSLFDRTSGRLTPTAEGEALYVEVERGMLGLDRIASTARELREGNVGRVRIAFGGGMSPDYVNDPNAQQHFAELKALLDRVNVEDRGCTEKVYRGLCSDFARPGPLSHLERPNYDFAQYLAGRIAASNGARA